MSVRLPSGAVSGILKPLGQVLREARREKGILQSEVATSAGVSRSVVSRLESGQRWPEGGPDEIVAAYARECGVSVLQIWRCVVKQL